MSIETVARQFVVVCNQGKDFDVTRTMYAPTIVSAEGGGEGTAGQTPVIRESEVWQANDTTHGDKARGPSFNGPNQFAVPFTFEVTPKATGKRITLDEVGVYTVKDDKITREQFFYGGER